MVRSVATAPSPVVLVEQSRELLGGDQRLIAGEDDHGPDAAGSRLAIPEHGLASSEHGRPGALTLALLGDLDALRQPLGNTVTGPDDRNDPLGTGAPERHRRPTRQASCPATR